MLKRLLILFVVMVYAGFAHADNFANQPEVKIFIKKMVKKHHFKEAELVALFNAVKIRPKVMQQVRAPLEQKPWYTYQTLFLTEARINQGVAFWNKYKEVLKKAEEIYGVPASIVVATIGIETKYGRHIGEYRVIDALANIAFSDSKRKAFFRNELEQFLLLTREQHLNPLTILGSYAGAIGQPQFMPSSYRNYAINFSGNSKIDLSNNVTDVIGSVANYYHKHGWMTNQPVALPLSNYGGRYQLRLTHPRTPSQIELLNYSGVSSDTDLRQQSKILELDSYYGSEYWVSFHNFDVIKRYNPSDLYAMAVYQLSYHIASLREKLNDV